MKDRKKERMLSEGQEVVDSSSTESSSDTGSSSDRVSLHGWCSYSITCHPPMGIVIGYLYYSGYDRPPTYIQ